MRDAQPSGLGACSLVGESGAGNIVSLGSEQNLEYNNSRINGECTYQNWIRWLPVAGQFLLLGFRQKVDMGLLCGTVEQMSL